MTARRAARPPAAPPTGPARYRCATCGWTVETAHRISGGIYCPSTSCWGRGIRTELMQEEATRP